VGKPQTKLKTHKGAKKRFRITPTGKILRTKGMKSHNRRKKAPRVKRQFDRMLELDGANKRQVRKLLPYGVG
jgi:large subunit ribosomal protein L35